MNGCSVKKRERLMRMLIEGTRYGIYIMERDCSWVAILP
jgi:hypothetical protein